MLLEKDKVRLIEEGKTKEQEIEDKIKELEIELVTLRTEKLEKLETEKKELL